MEAVEDHLNAASCSVVVKDGVTRLVGRGTSIHFDDENPEYLQRALNTAAEKAYRHYERLNQQTLLSTGQLSYLSVMVAANFLFMYSDWRRRIPEEKDLELELKSADLVHPQSHTICYDYCRKIFGLKFRQMAAQLMGMSPSELKDYEIGREWRENL